MPLLRLALMVFLFYSQLPLTQPTSPPEREGKCLMPAASANPFPPRRIIARSRKLPVDPSPPLQDRIFPEIGLDFCRSWWDCSRWEKVSF